MSKEPSLCTACGRRLSVEAHHIAGEANDPATTNVCIKGCHQFLSRRQLDNGVNLDRQAQRSDVDMARAKAHGLNDLFSLSTRRRQPGMVPMVEAFDSCTHITSALLDLTDDPDRPGRSLPDPIGARHRPPLSCGAVNPAEGAEIPVVEQLIAAVFSLGESLLMDERELAALARFAEEAESLYEKIGSLLEDAEIQEVWSEVPDRMEAFGLRFQKYLVDIYSAVVNDTDAGLNDLIETGLGLAPVFRAMETFIADMEAAVTADECRELLLRLPGALDLSESLAR